MRTKTGDRTGSFIAHLPVFDTDCVLVAKARGGVSSAFTCRVVWSQLFSVYSDGVLISWRVRWISGCYGAERHLNATYLIMWCLIGIKHGYWWGSLQCRHFIYQVIMLYPDNASGIVFWDFNYANLFEACWFFTLLMVCVIRMSRHLYRNLRFVRIAVAGWRLILIPIIRYK